MAAAARYAALGLTLAAKRAGTPSDAERTARREPVARA